MSSSGAVVFGQATSAKSPLCFFLCSSFLSAHFHPPRLLSFAPSLLSLSFYNPERTREAAMSPTPCQIHIIMIF